MYKLTITKMDNENHRDKSVIYQREGRDVIYVPPEEKIKIILTDEEFKAIKKAILEVM